MVKRKLLERLESQFLDFAHALERGQVDLYRAESPASVAEIDNIEARVGVSLPGSFKRFLRCSRFIMLDHPVIHIGLESVFFPRDHMGKLDNTQLVFAEFWLNADGDSVFFDLIHKYVSGEYPVMYYSHEDHPPRIKKLADSFSEFINHCFEYEEWW